MRVCKSPNPRGRTCDGTPAFSPPLSLHSLALSLPEEERSTKYACHVGDRRTQLTSRYAFLMKSLRNSEFGVKTASTTSRVLSNESSRQHQLSHTEVYPMGESHFIVHTIGHRMDRKRSMRARPVNETHPPNLKAVSLSLTHTLFSKLQWEAAQGGNGNGCGRAIHASRQSTS